MKTRRLWPFQLIVLLTIFVVAGCSAASAPISAPAAPTETRATAAPAIEATATLPPAVEATSTTALTATPEPTVEPAATPAPTEPPAAPEPTAAPAAELSLAQTLAAAFTDPPTAAGEMILVTGQVLDLAGNPLPGAAVEFWQTDAEGIYDHPGDSGTANRDRGFQFYGASIADAEGRYVFRTIQPGYYEPRPRHIHVKVKLDGRTLLTTQFYFEEDVAVLGNEGLFAQAGSLGSLLILQTVDSVDMAGGAVDLLANNLVIDTGSPGSLTATPLQGEGPYYPVVSVAEYDNDLAAVP
jgi:protocatechuate 3,4-dioxygenase beta subunit